MADARVTDIKEFKASRMPAFRLGTLEIESGRIKLVADCRLTAGAARTLAAQLLVMAEQVETRK